MPTKRTRPLAVVIALTAVLSMTPWLIAAEGKPSQLAHAGHATPSPAADEGANPAPESLPGEGLRYQHDEGAGSIGGGGKRLEVYSFGFDKTAYIPQGEYPEAMMVHVESGSFSFCVGEDDFVIVDPGVRGIHAERTIPIQKESCDLFSMPDPSGKVVERLDGAPCTQLCALPPDKTVLIEEGATVYLPEATTCFWCNVTAGGKKANLLVFPVRPQEGDLPFSWTDLDGIVTPEAQAFATPQAEALDGARHFRRVTLSGLGVGCR